MKQYRRSAPFAALFLTTTLLIGGLSIYRYIHQSAIPTVTTTMIAQQDVAQTVVCSGTVSVGEGVKVYAPIPCVVQTVAVSVGDRVKAGDVLVTMDSTATLAMAGKNAASLSGVFEGIPTESLTVTAPVDGVVNAVGVAAGDSLDTSSPCVVLSEHDDVVIAVTLRESVLPKVEVGQAVAVSGVAFDKAVYHGVITEIASSARSRVNGTSGETVVDAVVTLLDGEADSSLLVGLTAKATVTVDTQQQVLVVPYECVVQDEETAAVFIAEGETVTRRTVVTGKETAEGMIVEKGVAAGDRLVVQPDRLVDGTVWQVAEASS